MPFYRYHEIYILFDLMIEMATVTIVHPRFYECLFTPRSIVILFCGRTCVQFIVFNYQLRPESRDSEERFRPFFLFVVFHSQFKTNCHPRVLGIECTRNKSIVAVRSVQSREILARFYCSSTKLFVLMIHKEMIKS